MSEQLTIDTLEFARRGKCLEGQVAVSDMPRLQDLLLSRNGSLNYKLHGSINAEARPRLRLEVDGLLVMECQRCLGELEFPVNIAATLELVMDEESLIPVEEEEDSVDLVSAEPTMDVLAMVEDEVLLNLPAAPAHPPGACHAANFRTDAELDEANPFKVLATLKKNV